MTNGRVSFPTHAEAAYPEILCERIASLLKQQMLKQGAIEVNDLTRQVQSQGKSLNCVVLGALPRGKHVKPLVSEYAAYINAVSSVQCDAGLQSFLKTLPKGSNVQSRLLSTWGAVREAMEKQAKKSILEKKLDEFKKSSKQDFTAPDPYTEVYIQFGCLQGTTYRFLAENDADFADDEACEKVTIAIPREPMDFLCRAVAVGHPRSVALQLPDALQEVVEWNRDSGDAAAYSIHKHRVDFVKHWTNRAKELSAEDGRMLASAPEHLQRLLVGKRLALWQAMVEHDEYLDKDLVTDIIQGFPLTGWLPDSQVFPKDFKPPSMDVHTSITQLGHQ